MIASFYSAMSTKSNPEANERIVEIHEKNHEKPNNPTAANASGDPPAEDQSLVINRFLRCATDFFHRLQAYPTCFKRVEPKHMSKDEVGAYEMLMVDLSGEREEHPWSSVKEFLIWLGVLIFFIALMVISAFIHKVHTKSLLNLGVNRWIALFMVLILGLPCIRFVTLVISEPLVWISWHTHMRKNGIFYVRKMKRSFDVTLWFGLLLWVWDAWYDTEITHDTAGAKRLHVPPDKYGRALVKVTEQITRMLLALTIAGILWTIKTGFYSYLKANLHYRYLCPRIRRTILDLYGIQFIDGEENGNWSFLIKQKNGRSHNNIKNDENNVNPRMSFWVAISHLNEDKAPVWILKRLSFMYKENMRIRRPKVLLTLETTNDDEKFMKEAKRLYNNVVGGECKKRHITATDLGKYGLQKAECDYVFKLFNEKDETTIAEDQFLRWAVTAFKNCLGLESTIYSSERIFLKLNVLLSFGVVVLAIVIWLLLSELVSTAQLAILFTPFISASFIFGESLKNTFGGLVFVFGMHPFDVGDRVVVDNVQMKVNKLKLLTTIFFQFDTGDEVTYPNSELAIKKIVNLDINKNMSDSVEFNISINTPKDLMLDLQTKIKKSLDEEVTFTSDTIVAKKEIKEDNVTLVVCFKYLVAYHLSEIKTRHRSMIIEMIMRRRKEMQEATELEKAFERLKDKYECDIVKFSISSKMKLVEIEELSKNITDFLQGQDSSFKDFSKVIFTGFEKRKMIGVEVQMRNKPPLRPGVDKEKIKQKIETIIQEKGGVLADPKQGDTTRGA